MSDVSGVKALIFDVFGTVVDWRTSLIADFTAWGEKRGIKDYQLYYAINTLKRLGAPAAIASNASPKHSR